MTKVMDYIKIWIWWVYGIIVELLAGRYYKFTGVGMGFGQFKNKVMDEQEPFVLETAEGKVIIAHGLPNGLMLIDADKMLVGTYQDLCKKLQLNEGNYYILSCHNGTRDDFTDKNYDIKRVPFTCTPYPAIAWVFGGALYCLSSIWTQKALDLAMPYIIEKLQKAAQA